MSRTLLVLAAAAVSCAACSISPGNLRENGQRQAVESRQQPKLVAECMLRNAQSKFKLTGQVSKGAAPLDLVFSVSETPQTRSFAYAVADLKSEDFGSRIGMFVNSNAPGGLDFGTRLVEGC